MSKTIEKCIQEILKNIETRKTVDYGDKASVRRYNAAYDRILRNVMYIEKNYPEHQNLFMEMLSHQDAHVAYCFACLILNRFSYGIEQRKQALSVVKNVYNTRKLNGIIIPYLVIQDWEETLRREAE